jgi:hypothetical protein
MAEYSKEQASFRQKCKTRMKRQLNIANLGERNSVFWHFWWSSELGGGSFLDNFQKENQKRMRKWMIYWRLRTRSFFLKA